MTAALWGTGPAMDAAGWTSTAAGLTATGATASTTTLGAPSTEMGGTGATLFGAADATSGRCVTPREGVPGSRASAGSTAWAGPSAGPDSRPPDPRPDRAARPVRGSPFDADPASAGVPAPAERRADVLARGPESSERLDSCPADPVESGESAAAAGLKPRIAEPIPRATASAPTRPTECVARADCVTAVPCRLSWSRIASSDANWRLGLFRGFRPSPCCDRRPEEYSEHMMLPHC